MTSNFEKDIVRIVADQLGKEEEMVTNSANIRDDLGADSLDEVEIILQLEEHFTVEIPDEQAEQVKTVGDIISCITCHLPQAK